MKVSFFFPSKFTDLSNSTSPTPYTLVAHSFRVLGPQFPEWNQTPRLEILSLWPLSLPKVAKIQESIPCQWQTAKSEHSKPKLYLREGPLSLLTMEGIHCEKISVYLGCFVNVPLKPLEHTTRRFHPPTDFNATA